MHDLSIPNLFLVLAVMLIAAKLLGELAERFGQPAVLGELIAGVLLGGSVLAVIPVEGTGAEIIHVLAELGVVLLLFEIGLETDLREMFRVGTASLSVAAVGVVLPFALGFAYWAYLPHAASSGTALPTAAIFVGETLTATSVGITARVLSDLGQMNSEEAKIIIGAAIIDDVLGLVILTVVSGMVAGTSVSAFGVLRVLTVAVGFLVIAVLVGRFAAPRLFDLVVRMRVRYVLLVFAFAFALALSATAAAVGSALIIGAFAAGLILSGTNQFDTIEHEIRPVASIFAPIFFVSVGASVNLRLLDPSRPGAGGLLGVAAVLIVLAVVGKLVAGWAAPWVKFRRLVVGAGILNEAVFGAILLMVMATTFIAPPGLKVLFGSRSDQPS